MMVELVVCFLPAGKRLAVDGNGAVGIGAYAMPVIFERINMHAARPHMDLFTLAVVGHMNTIPANMNLFALIGINNVDAVLKGNVDEWLVTTASIVSGVLSLFGLIRSLGAAVAVSNCLPVQQLIQRHAIQCGERNEVIGIGRGFAAFPFADSLAAHTQLGGKRLLRKPGSFASIDEPLRHCKIHGSSFRMMIESNGSSMSRTTGSDHHF